MYAFQETDCVTVVKLLAPARQFTSGKGRGRPPAVGDSGVVVTVHERDGRPVNYIVECVDAHGTTVWLADFEPGELELAY